MRRIVVAAAAVPSRRRVSAWIFYAATCYTWLGDDEPAEEHARELIAYHARPDGSSNAPMRTAMSHIDLGLIRAWHTDLDEAVHRGLTAFSFDREPRTTALVTSELAQISARLRSTIVS